MTQAIIFANGEMDAPPEMVKNLGPYDLIIAADGGSRHCMALGIKPNVIIGDFDSLDSDEITYYQKLGVKTRHYPSHKDETDLELALQFALKEDSTQVIIIAALGARWDMTIANILLLAHPRFSSLKISLLDGSQEIILLRGKDRVDIPGSPGHLISLIPIAGDAHGITTHGLEYPLHDETLYFGSSRGVSNVFLQDSAQISIKKGLLLCVIDRGDN